MNKRFIYHLNSGELMINNFVYLILRMKHPPLVESSGAFVFYYLPFVRKQTQYFYKVLIVKVYCGGRGSIYIISYTFAKVA